MTSIAPYLTLLDASSLVHRTPRRRSAPSLFPSHSPTYTCSYPNCDMELYSHALLKLHEKTHMPKDPKRAAEFGLASDDASKAFVCMINGCSAAFDRQYEYTRHKWTHIPRAMRPRCEGTNRDGTPCDYLYPGRTDVMKKHWASKHEGEFVPSSCRNFRAVVAQCERMGIELIPSRVYGTTAVASSTTARDVDAELSVTSSALQESFGLPEDILQWALELCDSPPVDPLLEQDLSFDWLGTSNPASNGFDMFWSDHSDFNWLNPNTPFDTSIAFA